MFEVLKKKASLKLKICRRQVAAEVGVMDAIKSCLGSQSEKSFSCVLFTEPGKCCLP